MLQEKIIDLFVDTIGRDNIILEPATLENAEKTNYRTFQKIIAILKPANVAELSKCMVIANEYSIPVYTVSKGKNWGYGSRVPVKDNSILIELERLNNITDYNEKLGYITIEPGVTFQQAFDFLRERKSELIISITGGSTASSLIGNALERGIGTGLYADRFSNVCGLEVVLPDGKVISTGFKRYGDSISSNIYKWGMGPSVDALFSQSNFGIVTKLTLWLMPCPEYFQLIFYKINEEKKLPPLINTLREMALNGLVRPTVTVYNDFRVFSTMVQYPWGKCTPGINSSKEVMKVIRDNVGISNMVGMWNGEISIRSVSPEHGKMQYELIKERISDYAEDIALVEVSKADILKALDDQYHGNFGGHEKDLIKSFLIRKYIGIPDNLAIRQTYWRKKTPIPSVMDPDVDKCGMIWICPIVPFAGEDIETAVGIITDTIEKYSFEPSISLQCMSERAINIIGSIGWDREIEGEDKRAEDCYMEVNNSLKAKGYFAYRGTTLGMVQKNATSGDNYDTFINNIKKAIDPNDILAPGRYNIG